MRIPVVLIVAFSALGAFPGSAQNARSVTTNDHVRTGDRVVGYTAEAGRIPIRAMAADEPRAHIFYVAYRTPSPDATPRPITFIWGGGPSSSGLGSHMSWGPKRVTGGEVAANDHTLLTVSDLVFVDPVGTGFSRPTRPEHAQEFYGVRGDAASVAEFIRAWLTLHDPDDSPVFLFGASYGVWRASAVAELLEQRGIPVTGAILASGGMGVGVDVAPHEIVEAHRIPARAATALHHGRLPAEIATTRDDALAAAERWALDVYAPALRDRDDLSDPERGEIARQLARFTGYPERLIDRETLRVRPREYLAGMLREEGRTLQQYDMRRTVEEREGATGQGGGGQADATRRLSYLRDDLGYRTDLAYLGVERGYDPVSGPTYRAPGQRWDYDTGTITPEVMTAAQAGEGPPGSEPWMVRAIELNPTLRVLVAAGLFDSLNSCSGNRDLKERLDPQVAAAFTLKCYIGGHGFHREPGPARDRFSADLREFIRETIDTDR